MENPYEQMGRFGGKTPTIFGTSMSEFLGELPSYIGMIIHHYKDSY